MDDHNFNEKSAAKWISLIEKGPTSPRDGDIYPYINTWLEKSKAQNVLDLGCGQGVCAQKLNLKNTLYSGVDPSVWIGGSNAYFFAEWAVPLSPKGAA